ncbi:MAG: S-layer family protein [Rhizonema sp. PD38]|nr:S-layer family protein [Rhizonema sp. PD38]
MRDGAQLSASTFGQGNAGNVTVNALDAVSLTNANILSTVEAGGVGKGGNININAATLSLIDGAQLLTITRGATATQPAGRGNAGDVNVKVTREVDIAGQKNGFLSGIRSFVEPGTVGNGGNITIDSGSFSLRDGAQLSASTFGQGNAGNITVNAAANLTISGKSSDYISGLYVNSQSPTGTTGDIIVTSPRVTLDSSGILNAQSASGNGGNINLQSDLLLVRRGSLISTTAGTAQKGGDGGNIAINSKFLIAIPEENSDITANAFTGKGGSVRINTQGIFGTQFRPQLTPESDITASSTFGVSGIVNINAPDTSFLQNSFTQLPQNLINTNALIANSCIARTKKQQGTFNITGPGGLPNRPLDASVSSYPTGTVRNVQGNSISSSWHKGNPIVEPQAIYKLPNGHLVLSRECS